MIDTVVHISKTITKPRVNLRDFEACAIASNTCNFMPTLWIRKLRIKKG